MFTLEAKDLGKLIVWRILGNTHWKWVFGERKQCLGSVKSMDALVEEYEFPFIQ